MKYRDHRGSLDDSLQTTIEITDITQLFSHINKSFTGFGLEVEDIKFEYMGMDTRIAWDTWYVLYRLKGKKQFFVAGMSDGNLEQ